MRCLGPFENISRQMKARTFSHVIFTGKLVTRALGAIDLRRSIDGFNGVFRLGTKTIAFTDDYSLR